MKWRESRSRGEVSENGATCLRWTSGPAVKRPFTSYMESQGMWEVLQGSRLEVHAMSPT